MIYNKFNKQKHMLTNSSPIMYSPFLIQVKHAYYIISFHACIFSLLTLAKRTMKHEKCKYIIITIGVEYVKSKVLQVNNKISCHKSKYPKLVSTRQNAKRSNKVLGEAAEENEHRRNHRMRSVEPAFPLVVQEWRPVELGFDELMR